MIKETFTHLPAEKKAFILQKAHQSFADQGFDATTVRDIVNLAQIPRGSFYQYFDDLVDVFQACVHDMSTKKLAHMQGLMDKAGTIPFIELYEEIMLAGIHFAYAFRVEAVSIARVLRASHPSIQAIHRSIKDQGLELYKSLIEADKKAGFMSPFISTDVLARSLYGFNEHELMVWFEEGMEENALIEAALQYLQIIKDGIH